MRLHFAEFSGRLDSSLSKGVPSHPLYKHLARALTDWIVTGAFPRTTTPMPGISEKEAGTDRVDRWTPKVLELGSYLLAVSFCQRRSNSRYCVLNFKLVMVKSFEVEVHFIRSKLIRVSNSS
jgi:hypothetical protein